MGGLSRTEQRGEVFGVRQMLPARHKQGRPGISGGHYDKCPLAKAEGQGRSSGPGCSSGSWGQGKAFVPSENRKPCWESQREGRMGSRRGPRRPIRTGLLDSGESAAGPTRPAEAFQANQ